MSKTVKLLLVGLALLVLAAGGVALVFYFQGIGSHRVDLITHNVHREKLQLTIVERGTLEAAKNFDVVCRVKAGAKGSTVASTIKQVIDDGMEVYRDRPEKMRLNSDWWMAKKAVLLPKRDPEGNLLKDRMKVLETAQIITSALGGLFNPYGQPFQNLGVVGCTQWSEYEEWVWADLLAELDKSGLEEQAKTQKITVDQAEAKFITAEENYKIQVSSNDSDIGKATSDVKIAELDLKKYLEGEFESKLKDVKSRILQARSDLELWRDRYAWSERMAAGKYISEAQKEGDKARLRSAELALEKVEEELRVLEKYDFLRQKTDLESKLDVAKATLDKTEKQARAKIVQAEADRSAQKSIYEQEKKRYDDILEQINNCTIYAEMKGLVVYYIPEQARWGGGSRQSLVAQGEPVSEGQKLMRIPNLQNMLVNTRVHEAMVSRVRPYQAARVRVDAFPGRDLKARVKTVATVASQQDFLSADVKVYQTMVEIEENIPGLKPGMSAEVTILTDSLAENALTIPIQAVLGTVEMGRQRKCYVVTPTGPQEREIVVGISNEKMVEVKEGLEEGDQVVVNPRLLLSEKERKTLGPEKGGTKNGPPEAKTGPGPGEPAAGPGPTAGPGPGKPPDKTDAGPGGPKPGKPGKPKGSSEDRAKMMEEMLQRFRQASPEERKQMLDQIPEGFRDKVRQTLKGKGIDVPN